MKPLSAFLAIVVGCATVRGEIAFEGYIVTPERSLFTVSIGEEKRSGWLTLGQSFEGYVLSTFDPTVDLLTVEKSGQRHVLRLVDAKVQPMQSAPRPDAATIVISIAGQETIALGDDATSLETLRVKLTLAAAKVPQPRVSIQASPFAKFERLAPIVALCQNVGLKKVSLATTIGDAATHAPEPTPATVATPTSQKSR